MAVPNSVRLGPESSKFIAPWKPNRERPYATHGPNFNRSYSRHFQNSALYLTVYIESCKPMG